MKNKKNRRNLLIIASSEEDSNLYYASGFLAPDPFVYLKIRGRPVLLMNDLEVDRARKESRVRRVISLSCLAKAYRKRHGKSAALLRLVAEFLKKERVRSLTVPGNLGIAYADALRAFGFRIRHETESFFPERAVKTPSEIRAISRALRAIEKSFKAVVRILKRSRVKNRKLYDRGKILTSESLRHVIRFELLKSGFSAGRIIVSCGKDSVDPHAEGSGPLYAHRPIIIDIFPRDIHSRYWGDFTRTVVKGKASPKLKKMYSAVKEAQKIALRMIRHGQDAALVHAAVHRSFEARGFPTGVQDGRMQGFFHSTGHGLGLDIHELPRLGLKKEILKSGEVITVEPGLYYKGAGGVRLEDVVVVTRSGCLNLTRFPKILEI